MGSDGSFSVKSKARFIWHFTKLTSSEAIEEFNCNEVVSVEALLIGQPVPYDNQ